MKKINGKTVVCELVANCTDKDNDCDRRHHRYICADGTTYGRASYISRVTKRRRVTMLHNVFRNFAPDTAEANIAFFLSRGYKKA